MDTQLRNNKIKQIKKRRIVSLRLLGDYFGISREAMYVRLINSSVPYPNILYDVYALFDYVRANTDKGSRSPRHGHTYTRRTKEVKKISN